MVTSWLQWLRVRSDLVTGVTCFGCYIQRTYEEKSYKRYENCFFLVCNDCLTVILWMFVGFKILNPYI